MYRITSSEKSEKRQWKPPSKKNKGEKKTNVVRNIVSFRSIPMEHRNSVYFIRSAGIPLEMGRTKSFTRKSPPQKRFFLSALLVMMEWLVVPRNGIIRREICHSPLSL
jgi:hypothetical protein